MNRKQMKNQQMSKKDFESCDEPEINEELANEKVNDCLEANDTY